MKKFILGVLAGTLGITILESLQEIIATFGELIKGKMGVQIVKYNEKMAKATNNEPMRAIGFATTIEENEDEEYVTD